MRPSWRCCDCCPALGQGYGAGTGLGAGHREDDVARQPGGPVLVITVRVQFGHVQRQHPPGLADLPHHPQDLGAIEPVGDGG
jgi:hypothetical protein